MRDLLGLAATLLQAGSAVERAGPTRTVLVVVTATIAGLCAVGMAICLLAALWLYEMPLLGEIGAPLVVAAVLAGVGLIAGVILHAKTNAPPPPPPPHPLVTGTALVSSLMRSNKSLILLGALFAGFVASESERR